MRISSWTVLIRVSGDEDLYFRGCHQSGLPNQARTIGSRPELGPGQTPSLTPSPY